MRREVTADGKIELDYGKEDLNKEPSCNCGKDCDCKKCMAKKDIKTPAKEMVEEHEQLVDVLESKSHKDDKKEAKKQKKELKEYKKEMMDKSFMAYR